MRNLKELDTILCVLYYYNRLSEHESVEIRELLDYAFDRVLERNTNMLILACIGRNLEESRPELDEILKRDTKFFEYKARKEAIRKS
ncbi:MAG: hypothetical protein IKA61_01850 [Clostridia bacterium]|nr:hypothetical protein [Clostridia bacterium]